jgi:(p)ppGpp synthase/HD superfamily hydrolase
MTQKRNQWKMLSKMIAIVSEEFNGRLDKGGRPYVTHCIRVMDGVDQNDPEQMQIAMGHDLIEDSEGRWTAQRLREEGFSERVVKAIERLTHDPDMDYMEYIRVQVAPDPDSKAVKKSDLRDNTKVTRLKSLREKDFVRMQKYHTAYAYLSDGIENPKA